MKAEHIDVATFTAQGTQERFHPVDLPHNRRTANFRPLCAPWVDLLHEQRCGLCRIHVGLRSHVWFVECKHMLGRRFVLVNC